MARVSGRWLLRNVLRELRKIGRMRQGETAARARGAQGRGGGAVVGSDSGALTRSAAATAASLRSSVGPAPNFKASTTARPSQCAMRRRCRRAAVVGVTLQADDAHQAHQAAAPGRPGRPASRGHCAPGPPRRRPPARSRSLPGGGGRRSWSRASSGWRRRWWWSRSRKRRRQNPPGRFSKESRQRRAPDRRIGLRRAALVPVSLAIGARHGWLNRDKSRPCASYA